MITALKIGVLDLQGAVSEHVHAAERAMANLNVKTRRVCRVKYAEEICELTHLIIGGGESTTISKLMARNGIDTAIKRAAGNGLKIFGTCAGAILLAQRVEGLAAGQRTIGLMDMRMRRNAFGRQAESCERRIGTSIGNVDAVFIRAPSILKVGKGVEILAQTKKDGDISAVQQGKQFLATVFHPELGGSTKFHEHFLKLV